MKTHEEYIKNFCIKNAEIMEKYPKLANILINCFNEGFSAGAEWIMDRNNRKK